MQQEAQALETRTVALVALALSAAIGAWAAKPDLDPEPALPLAAAPSSTCRLVVPAAARDGDAALQHLRRELDHQGCRAGSWLEVRGLPVQQAPRGQRPVPDWTARLCVPGNLYEEADTGPVANFNCTYAGRVPG